MNLFVHSLGIFCKCHFTSTVYFPAKAEYKLTDAKLKVTFLISIIF